MREAEALFAAGTVAADVLGRDETARQWDQPSCLTGYTVGGLVGHLLAAVRRAGDLLTEAAPGAGAPVLDLAGFYGPNRAGRRPESEPDGAGLHELLRTVGEQEGSGGPAAVAAGFRSALAALAARLPGVPPDRLVPVLTVPGAYTTLAAYLASRVVELVVHTDDLVVSVGLEPVGLPPEAAPVFFETMVTLARARSGDVSVIRAFTRTGRAPADVLRVL